MGGGGVETCIFCESEDLAGTGIQRHGNLVLELGQIKGLDHVVVGGNGFHILLERVVGRAQNHRQVIVLVSNVLKQI